MSEPVKVAVKGFRGAGTSCGIKKTGKADLAMVVSDRPCASDVVFTRNRVFAAPVAWGKGLRSRSALRGAIVNSGNANACTGKEGIEAVRKTSAAACAALGLPGDSLLVSSTGVIGMRLPVEKIVSAVPGLCASLSADGIGDAGDAILTTDAYPKRALRKVHVGKGEITLGGIAKGAGMIAPNMGTMLAYVFTDASVRPGDLRTAFRGGVEASFNRIVVDGDTSTNDTAAVFANGACGLPPLAGKYLPAFSEALRSLLLDLAIMIVRDGEGTTRVVRLAVTGARSDRDAEKAARAAATSPLVKTAVFGADPNWGRVVAAAGRAGAAVEQDRIELSFAGEKVLRRGLRIDRAAERRAAPKIRGESYDIELDLGLGKGSHFLYFSDLTHDYIRINAGYRT
ncbi:MAG: bifunctional glutamate N-acetyltransferase/amino-acid acetyltransferase ArgJ [Deltaproteobacteria bacterium]|nr:bifunctional glutamate N-acetyltransferase/amino-acid acetyltransferase ArgJ [Deltaproteobacteria bacterium]